MLGLTAVTSGRKLDFGNRLHEYGIPANATLQVQRDTAEVRHLQMRTVTVKHSEEEHNGLVIIRKRACVRLQ